MAIASKKRFGLEGLVLHSDGGGQYYDACFTTLVNDNKMISSMCEMAQENGMAERLNGVIKNNYLIHRPIKTFDQLVKQVDRTVRLYNHQKPHAGLKRSTPAEYEKKWAIL